MRWFPDFSKHYDIPRDIPAPFIAVASSFNFMHTRSTYIFPISREKKNVKPTSSFHIKYFYNIFQCECKIIMFTFFILISWLTRFPTLYRFSNYIFKTVWSFRRKNDRINEHFWKISFYFYSLTSLPSN